MMKKDILAIMAVAMMAGGCSSKDEMQTQNELVPIRLTASVSVEAKTRSVDSQGEEHVVMQTPATRGVQETAIASGEKVYVWANETGSSSWDYLKAWTLTADGSTGLTGTTKYYPANGTAITMNAVHGNFSSEPSEDNTAIGTLTHSVVADQSAAGGYEKSDLLFGTVTGSNASTTAENIPFTHKLTKIEVNLTPGYGYDATDLATAEVHLNNVLPTVTIDPTDGSLGSASGTAVTITPRKDATSGTYEAVIPPQTFANPDALISVTTNNLTLTPPATLTSTVPNTVATFNENTKYVYNVTVNKLYDIKLNPLWYMAEYNISDYAGTTMATTDDAGYYFSWNDAMFRFAASTSSYNDYRFCAKSYTNGISGATYHLPALSEWYSIVPGEYDNNAGAYNIWNFSTGSGVYKSNYITVRFGYNSTTKDGELESSYWVKAGSNEVRAIRFLDKDYCSAWKYIFDGSVLKIYATLIDKVANNETAAETFYNTKWNSLVFGDDEEHGAVMRTLYPRGITRNGSMSSAETEHGVWGYYVSATTAPNNSNAYCLLYFNSSQGILYLQSREYTGGSSNYGSPVRLFRDN